METMKSRSRVLNKSSVHNLAKSRISLKGVTQKDIEISFVESPDVNLS